jgi:hypothetical protein
MTITTRDGQSYASSAKDIQAEIADYSRREYLATDFASPRCTCGGRRFRLRVDDTVGAGVRICAKCNQTHPIGDSAEFLAEASLDECECPCGKDIFQITVGVARYRKSDAVRWVYIGCRCPSCRLVAVYADWKNEHDDYRELLGSV